MTHSQDLLPFMDAGWGNLVGCRPDMEFTCDECGQQECWAEGGIVRVYRNDDNRDLCQWCIDREYAVDSIVLAFYPEMADFINKESGDLAATARSVTLDFGDLQGLVVIRSWDDFQTSREREISTIRIAVFHGKLKDEIIEFKAHLGFAKPARCARLSSWTNFSTPPHVKDLLSINSDTVDWIPMHEYNTYLPVKFRYNVFDKPGIDLVFEWARSIAKEWILIP